jgi:hypothetical protein
VIRLHRWERVVLATCYVAFLLWSVGNISAANANTLHCGKARWALRQAGRPAWGACHRRSTHTIRIRHYCVKLHHHPWWEFWDDNIYDTWRCYK